MNKNEATLTYTGSVCDQVNVRLPSDLNMWMNNTVWLTKRLHGSKVPKEAMLEAAIEFMKSRNLNWEKIRTKDDIIEALEGSKLAF